jgi:beta-1,2-rhamnosyltransferase WsaF-like protein
MGRFGASRFLRWFMLVKVPGSYGKSIAARLHGCFRGRWCEAHSRFSSIRPRRLRHYLKVGARAAYLAAYRDAADAIARGLFRSGFEHYVMRGALESRLPVARERAPANQDSGLASLFDKDWYDREYDLGSSPLKGLEHYLVVGARAGYSPNENFDEKFYLAFYRDVREAVLQRRFISGFEHYVLVGRPEERLPKHRLERTLEAKFPGITKPVGLHQVDELCWRLRPLPACSATGEVTYWFLLPTFNPDIFFGGYKAVIELIVALRARGAAVRVILCAQNEDGDYGRHLFAHDRRLREAFRDVVISGRDSLPQHLRISRNDKIFAYSAWEAHLAHKLAQFTNAKRFAFLVQEYEPVFHGHGAEHAITASAYDLPHYPIFNSPELTDYFRINRLGVFSGTRTPRRGADFAMFDHVLTRMDSPDETALGDRNVRRLVLYARPESHAQRNLFPLALIALRNVVGGGQFRGPWEFHGLGALKPEAIDLGRGERLILHPKMGEREYRAFMRSVDIGISLMYAPHPGLVSFEMASAGARVVTNTFENRTATHLRSISENIIPCAPTIEGIEQALTVAIATADDIPSRLRGARLRRGKAMPRTWSEVFNAPFFESDMAGYLRDGDLGEQRLIA